MTPILTAETAKPVRHFLPNDIALNTWDDVKPFYDQLLARPLNTAEDLHQWLKDESELSAFVDENSRWRYIHATINTLDKEAEQALEYFQGEIAPHLQVIGFELNKKLVACPFTDQLDPQLYFVYLRGIRKQMALFRETNVPLFKDESKKQNEYGAIIGKMSIEHDGKTLTLPQAQNLLKSKDRQLRQEIYSKINFRRLEDKDRLDKLFDELLALRAQIAKNAGFDNFRDYQFAALGRFDYTPQDCFDFHEAIATEVVPLVKQIHAERKQTLGVDVLKPWDLDAELSNGEPLQPFDGGNELAEKSIECMGGLDAFFGHCISTMRNMNRLDLDSRIGKAPGGYNMSMPETGVPFIFMNAAGADRDVKTMVHEGGHAVHSFLSYPLELDGFKSYPSEVAELASMSMELFTMDNWSVFYDNAEELTRSKKNQLEGIIKILPWIATIDKYQHWLYTHEGHSVEERKAAWLSIYDEFHSGVDWTDLEEPKAYTWQKQLHLYEVPFYYIEYGMAQLGAVAMWKQYKENPTAAIANYKAALSLGYTRTIGDIYKTAGISFRFDKAYIHELMQFLKTEFEKL